jgi:high-affinity iron transporter
MIPSFLIFLREGIEGSMIISLMCAYLAAAGRRDLFRWIFLGVGAAVAGSCVFGLVLYALAKDSFINSSAQTWFETIVFFLAVVTLTYMTFWMKSHSRSMSKDLKVRMGAAVAGGSAFSLGTLAFVTVGRESIETVIFLLAIAFKTPGLSLAIGAVLGLLAAIGASVAMYRLGVRINIRRFFMIVGSALMVVAAGLLSDGIQNLQELGALPGGGQVLWNSRHVLAEDTSLGDILHGVFGYAEAPTLLQAAVWAAFLSIGLLVFLGNRPDRRASSGSSNATSSG